MTALQKHIALKLLQGCDIYGNQVYGYRLRDEKKNVLLRFNYKTFYRLMPILRRKRSVYVLDKREVRKLHGSCFIKRRYKLHRTAPLTGDEVVLPAPNKKEKQTVPVDDHSPQLSIF